MTNPTTNSATDRDLQAGARAYLDVVASHLADLQPADRGELISDIADALSEQPRDASFETLVVTMGSPLTFATELRAAAGFPPAPPVASARASDARFGEIVVDRTDAALTWTGRELEPLWWIVRGLIVGAALFLVTAALGVGGVGSSRGGIAAFGLVAVVVSIMVGIRARVRAHGDVATPRALRVRGAVTLVGGTIFAVALANMVGNGGGSTIELYPTAFADGAAPSGLVLDGTEVTNVYAFDDQGQPIKNVRLFTDTGEPLTVFADSPDVSRQTYADDTSDQIFNVFPIRYTGGGPDGEVQNPDAGWPKNPGALRQSAAPAEPVSPVAPSVKPAVHAVPKLAPKAKPVTIAAAKRAKAKLAAAAHAN